MSETTNSMQEESLDLDNPFDSPKENISVGSRRFWLTWGLRGASVVFFMAALPAAGRGLELANQEYWKIFPVDRIVYDIEIQGEPVTIDQAIAIEAFIVVRTWFLSALLLWFSFRFSSLSPRPQKNTSTSSG